MSTTTMQARSWDGRERRSHFRVIDDAAEARDDYLAGELARMEQKMIDPREFGRLEGQVKSLDVKVDGLASDVKELLELANRSRGGMFAGMAIASALGGLASWLLSHFNLIVK